MYSIGSLFSGCGAMDLGFELAGFETKWFAETDKWCDKILNKNFPGIPNLGDVNELNPEPVDILIGGFPCQPVSQAGQKKAEEDDRWLWPGFYKTIRDLRPGIVVVENVPGLRKRGFDRVLGDLAEAGYNAQWFSLRSSDIGAPHRRERVFIIANSSVGWEHEADEGDINFQQSSSVDNSSTDSNKELLYRELEGGERRRSESSVSVTSDSSSIRTGRDSGETPREQEQIRWREEDNSNSFESSDEDATNSTSEGSQGRQSEEGRYMPAGCLTTDSYSDRLKGEWRKGSKWKDKPGDYTDRFASEEQQWGSYGWAVNRWAEIFEPTPPPLTYGGRLSPNFVEWMMGLPQDWTQGISRSQRLKMLGNSVQVQCAYEVAKIVKALADFS